MCGRSMTFRVVSLLSAAPPLAEPPPHISRGSRSRNLFITKQLEHDYSQSNKQISTALVSHIACDRFKRFACRAVVGPGRAGVGTRAHSQQETQRRAPAH